MSQTLPEQIAHVLSTHHELEWQMLKDLDAQISKSDDKRLTAPWRHLHDNLASHMNKEENVLFPAMLAMHAGTPGMDFKCAIDAMKYEHELLGTFEVAMRAAARDAGELEEPILALLDDLYVHAAFEDEHLFPAGLALREATMAEEDAETVEATEQAASAPRPDHAPYPEPVPGLRSRAHNIKERLKGLLRRSRSAPGRQGQTRTRSGHAAAGGLVSGPPRPGSSSAASLATPVAWVLCVPRQDRGPTRWTAQPQGWP
jgi:hypothetical protein